MRTKIILSSLLLLAGCSGEKTPEKTGGKVRIDNLNDSPVVVADGSVTIRHDPRFHVHGSRHIRVSEPGYAARYITIDGSSKPATIVDGKDWTLTSASGHVKITTIVKGSEIIVTTTCASGPFVLLDSDGIDGPGAQCADAAQFTPAKFKFIDGTGGDTLQCADGAAGKCAIRIHFCTNAACT
jgi:hypothetical protein